MYHLHRLKVEEKQVDEKATLSFEKSCSIPTRFNRRRTYESVGLKYSLMTIPIDADRQTKHLFS